MAVAFHVAKLMDALNVPDSLKNAAMHTTSASERWMIELSPYRSSQVGNRIELSELVVADEIPFKSNIMQDLSDLQKHDYLHGRDLPKVEGATTTC